MKNLNNHMVKRAKSSINEKILLALACLFMLSLFFGILSYAKYGFHSDRAGYLFLAKEQLLQKKMFPDGFHYTTEIFGFSPNLTMIVALLFCDNDLLVHEIGVILYVFIFFVAIMHLFRKKKSCACLAIIMLTMPISYAYMDMVFYQGAYLYTLLSLVFIFIAVQYLFDIDANDCKKKKVAVWVAFFFAFMFATFTSLRSYLQIILPMICAWGSMLLYREGGDIRRWKKQKGLLMCIVLSVVFTAISVLHYKVLCERLEFGNDMAQSGILSPYIWIERIGVVTGSILSLFSVSATESLLSLATIRVCMLLVFAVAVNFVVPMVMLLNIKKIKDSFLVFLTFFANFNNFFTMFLMVCVGYNEGRYYIPNYLCNLLLFTIFLYALYDKQREKFYVWPLVLPLGLALSMVVANFYTIYKRGQLDLSMDQLFNPRISTSVGDCLSAFDLTYGYATFWNAYSLMVYENSEVTIAAYDQGNPLMPYYFDSNNKENLKYYAVSERFYDPEQHPGRCFVLVADGEEIPEKYYRVADSIIPVDNYKVLIYNKNINYYPELVNE